MEERNDIEVEKMEEIMLPGFRFHPTDEELVGFYLKRKVQQRPLSIELIKQLDIYKYDPWDLPKLATTGEKEWYFYCPRDRKYRNSTRPNRVTGAGFWKATGTDRPIYSSEGNKCIGLKKSLVFYKGRAAKGIKTDWMMHEFRLPSLPDSAPPRRLIDRTIPPNDSWAICRIFKKTNSTTQRTFSHSWVSPLVHDEPSKTSLHDQNHHHFHSQTTPFTTESCTSSSSTTSALAHLQQYTNPVQNPNMSNFSPLDQFTPYKNINPILPVKTSHFPISNNSHDLITTLFSPVEARVPTRSSSSTAFHDASSLLFHMSGSIFGDFDGKPSEGDISTSDHNINGFSTLTMLPQQPMYEMSQAGIGEDGEDGHHLCASYDCSNTNTNVGFGIATMPMMSNLLWDSSSCLSDQGSTGFSTTKCYT